MSAGVNTRPVRSPTVSAPMISPRTRSGTPSTARESLLALYCRSPSVSTVSRVGGEVGHPDRLALFHRAPGDARAARQGVPRADEVGARPRPGHRAQGAVRLAQPQAREGGAR